MRALTHSKLKKVDFHLVKCLDILADIHDEFGAELYQKIGRISGEIDDYLESRTNGDGKMSVIINPTCECGSAKWRVDYVWVCEKCGKEQRAYTSKLFKRPIATDSKRINATNPEPTEADVK